MDILQYTRKKYSIEALTKQYRAQLQIYILGFVNQYFS